MGKRLNARMCELDQNKPVTRGGGVSLSSKICLVGNQNTADLWQCQNLLKGSHQNSSVHKLDVVFGSCRTPDDIMRSTSESEIGL